MVQPAAAPSHLLFLTATHMSSQSALGVLDCVQRKDTDIIPFNRQAAIFRRSAYTVSQTFKYSGQH
jgi:hypothetical protein